MEHPVSQRIKILIDKESKGGVVDFSNKLEGIPYQVISRLFKRDIRSGKYPTPSTELILQIINKFTSIDANWLLTGKGEMIKSEKKYSQEDNIPIANEDGSDSYQGEEYWRGRYDQLKEENKRLWEILEKMK